MGIFGVPAPRHGHPRRSLQTRPLGQLAVALLCAGLLGTVALPAAPALGESGAEAAHVAGEIIIAFKPGTTTAEIGRVFRQYGLLEQASLDAAGQGYQVRLVRLPESQTQIMAKVLRADPRVRYAELNFTLRAAAIPSDPRFVNQWGLNNTAQSGGTAGADIGAVEAWDVTTGSSAVIVAVIDTGVNYKHEDLAPNMWRNPGEVAGNGLDDDGNGYVDDVHGINTIAGTGDPMDDSGHGSHVAGILGAAGDNGIGTAGVAWTVRMAACKFLDGSGVGSIADAVKCFKYFNMLKRQYGVNIVLTNNSWYGSGYSQALYEAMAAADQPGMVPLLHTAAAGNRAGDNDAHPVYPANFDLPNLVSVAATGQNDAYAAFSDWGAQTVDIAAPGVSIVSTSSPGSIYATLSGTSMATPYVSGAAALIWSLEPGATATDVKDRLLSSTDAIVSRPGNAGKETVTNGRLNAAAALQAKRTPPHPVEDLTLKDSTLTTVTLAWTAPQGATAGQPAASYDLRYSATQIGNNTWETARRVEGLPTPATPGSTQEFTVRGLDAGREYWFALASNDRLGAASPLSNIVSGETVAGGVLFDDRMENGGSSWTVAGSLGLWHLSTRSAQSPPTAWYYGNEETNSYATPGQPNAGTITSPAINATAASEVLLTFSERSVLEPFGPFDFTRVQASRDRTNWTTVHESHGTGGAWVKRSVDLSAYTGGPLWIRFSFDTVDAFGNNYEGWYVDDVSVLAATGLVIVTSSLPEAPLGDPYTTALHAAGGTEPYGWAVVQGSSPAGLGLDEVTGAITGTPNASGKFVFGVRVIDAEGDSAELTLEAVVSAPLRLDWGQPPPADAGALYTFSFRGHGGNEPYQWALESGQLPRGLSLNPTTGAVSGKANGSGTSAFAVRLSDSSNPIKTATGSFSITVSRPLAIATGQLPGGTSNSRYERRLGATGGTEPYTWTLADGDLPPGLTLGPSSGEIAGTLNSAGTFRFTVQVADSSEPPKQTERGYSIRVGASPVIVDTSGLSGASVGIPYEQELEASGGTGTYSWSLLAGSLPSGLTLSTAGVISGTPSNSGSHTLIVKAQDSASPPSTGFRTLRLLVGKPLSISTTELPPATSGRPVQAQLKASGGAAPYTWRVASGDLPAGLTLTAGGRLTGTPNVTGTHRFVVEAADRGSPPTTASQELTLAVSQPLAISTSALPSGKKDAAYTAMLEAAGGEGQYTWRVVSGGLPVGLVLEQGTGRINGTPRIAGTFSITLRVSDAEGRSARRTVTLTLNR